MAGSQTKEIEVTPEMVQAEALLLHYEQGGGFGPRQLIAGILEIFESKVTADFIVETINVDS